MEAHSDIIWPVTCNPLDPIPVTSSFLSSYRIVQALQQLQLYSMQASASCIIVSFHNFFFLQFWDNHLVKSEKQGIISFRFLINYASVKRHCVSVNNTACLWRKSFDDTCVSVLAEEPRHDQLLLWLQPSKWCPGGGRKDHPVLLPRNGPEPGAYRPTDEPLVDWESCVRGGDL